MPVFESSKPHSQAETAVHLLIISSLWVLAALLVDYRGNFPLNDDWSYGIAVQRLVEEGVYDPTAWTSMSLLSQVLWGSLFSYLFGFSFEMLRLSTLSLSLLTLFGVYLIARQLNASGKVALFSTLLLAFNPVYLALSYTFMTDVPFMGFSTLALLFSLRYLNNESVFTLVIATAFATLAVLCRQTGLYVPIALALSVLYKYGCRSKALLVAAVPGMFCAGALLGYRFWLDHTARTPDLYGKQLQDLVESIFSPSQWPIVFAKSTVVAILYLGLFLVPLFTLLLASPTASPSVRWFKKWLVRAIVPVSVLLGVGLFSNGKLMPVGGNILVEEGIGPLTLYDVYNLKLPNATALPYEFWVMVTLLSILGAATLSVYLFSVIRRMVTALVQHQRTNAHYARFFLIAGGVIYLMPVLFLNYYDRYLLTPLVLVTLLLALDGERLPSFKVAALPVALLFLFAFYSVAGTHDYLAWNRARWQALRQLTEHEAVPYYQINGGFEYNGYMLFTDELLRTKKTDKWWTLKDDRYVITFGRIADYEVVQSYEYDRWLPPTSGQIFVLKLPPTP